MEEMEKKIKLRQISEFDGSKDIVVPLKERNPFSCINDGLKVKSIDGNNLIFTKGFGHIKEKPFSVDEGSAIEIPKRSTGIVSVDELGKLKYHEAQIPTDRIDADTYGFWVFDRQIMGETVPNSAVDKSQYAEENEFETFGGVNMADGWVGSAMKTSPGAYMRLQKPAPTLGGANGAFEINIMFTVTNVNSAEQYIMDYGTNICLLRMDKTNTLFYNGVSTNYVVSAGETIFFTAQYKNGHYNLYINGAKVVTAAATWTATSDVTNRITLGCHCDKASYPATIEYHFLEIRKDIRPESVIAEMANKLAIPLFYSKPEGIYPAMANEKTDYIEYTFDNVGKPMIDEIVDGQPTGNKVADVLQMSDTAGKHICKNVGTVEPTIRHHDMYGLGDSLKFTGAATCKMNFDIPEIGQDFTVISVSYFDAKVSNIRTIWGDDGTYANKFMLASTAADEQLQFYAGTGQPANVWINSGLKFQDGRSNFISMRMTKDQVTFQVNEMKSMVKNTGWFTPIKDVKAAFGSAYDDKSYLMNGSLSYFLFVPRALTDAEIQDIYEHVMKRGRRSIVNDLIPENETAVCFVRTDKQGVCEYNDTDYKYGRREGDYEGNRKVFLGWQYYNATGTYLKWKNPFGTPKIKTHFVYAEDPNGYREIATLPVSYYYNSGWMGVWENRGPNDATGNEITAMVYTANGVANDNIGWKTTGYLGCYAEVLEDYEGVDRT